VEDGTPEHAGRLHGDLGDLALSEPVGERQEIGGHGAKRANPPLHRPLWAGEQHTSGDRLLLDVQATAAGMKDLHRAPPSPHWATYKRRCGVREYSQVSLACSAPQWSGDSQRSWQHPSVSLTGGLCSTTLASTCRTGCPTVSRIFI